jgi:Family of unknown function (DUF5872)
MPPLPLQRKLYAAVKKQADATFEKPSAYKSGWIVKTYKSLGGRYASPDSDVEELGLDRWFREKWVDLNRRRSDGTYDRCGRRRATKEGPYPLCRPSVRVNRATPILASELSAKERRSALRRKSKRPHGRVRFRSGGSRRASAKS